MNNLTSGNDAVVVGGNANNASAPQSTVGGGLNNLASGSWATVPGGDSNSASGSWSFAAGRRAKAINNGAFVWADSQDAEFSSTAANQFLIRAAGGVGINKNNPAVALDVNGTVAATNFSGNGSGLTGVAQLGGGNVFTGAVSAPAFYSASGPLQIGTPDNQPLTFTVNARPALRLQGGTLDGNGVPSVLGGFSGNSIAPEVQGAVIGGGGTTGLSVNTITAAGSYSVIGGGAGHTVSAGTAVIAGGLFNSASQSNATVSGGTNNTASGPGAAVGGGSTNVASGSSSTVPGGALNTASGNFSLAAGRRARALHTGAFVWADNSVNTDFDSTADNQFNVRAAGGARLFTGGTGLKLDTDTVVFSGSAQRARFGDAANVDFNPLTSLDGLLLEQGTSESSGLFFDGDSITMWSPGDNGRLFRILDEDAMTGGAVAAERFYVDGNGGVFSAGGASFAGNVGIGSTTAGVTLDVLKSNANGAIENVVFKVRATYISGGQDTLFEVFNAPGSVVGNLRLSGPNAFKSGGGSWAVLSDARLKKNVENLHGSLDRLLRLRSVSFAYKDPAKGVGPGPQIGFIAQEVREVFPQWVTEGSDGMLAVSVTGFESLTVDALRELRTEKDRQIAELKTENTALKERLARLERAVEAMASPVLTTAQQP